MALGLNHTKDALLGSRNLGALGSKGSQGADFALEDKGTSKARHLKSTLDAQHILPCHCEECVSTTSQSYDLENPILMLTIEQCVQLGFWSMKTWSSL
ncbi:hypothetical protein IJ732_05650 [bacterium]|nr:hypothetical protein [bacterium]